ncbi:MAG TPA: serine hydrolase [Fimbriiglobus sp.]|nr:serine hydrolase [Fimbriiglobus sp.]
MTRLGYCLAVVLACAVRAPAADPASLEDRIAPIANAHKGKIAVAVKNLRTGEEYYLNADEPMTTASLIKLSVMVEAYWQAEEGKVRLDKVLTLTKDDKVPGSGVLTDSFTPGAMFALRDAIRLMITVSDNTATNKVLDEIGIAAPGERMASLGFKNTKINAKVFKGSTTSIAPERTKKYGLGSTTARETVQLLELIHKRKVVSPKACDEMLGILQKNQDDKMIVRFLPPGTSVAHKTGAVSNARTDAGIVSVRDPADKKVKPLFAICVLTNDNEDKRWLVDNAAQVTIGKIAKAAFDYFSATK